MIEPGDRVVRRGGGIERTARAIVRDAYGFVDVLRFAEIDRPVADETEMLVRVRAAVVWRLLRGTPLQAVRDHAKVKGRAAGSDHRYRHAGTLTLEPGQLVGGENAA